MCSMTTKVSVLVALPVATLSDRCLPGGEVVWSDHTVTESKGTAFELNTSEQKPTSRPPSLCLSAGEAVSWD